MYLFQEKVLIPIIVALVVLVVGANPWKFDAVQRLSIAIALIAASVFLARTLSLKAEKEVKQPQSETANSEPAEPRLQVISNDQKGGITAQTVIQGDQINAPQLNVSIENFFSASPPKDLNSDDSIESREFRLLLKPAATITLGECPGENCMQFKLGGRKEENGTIVQTIFLSGEGLGLVTPDGPYHGIRLAGKFRVKRAAMVATTDGQVGVDFPLKAETEFDVVTSKYVVTIRLTDVAIDNLKLRMSYRFAKQADSDSSSDAGSDVTFMEFELMQGIPPPSFILGPALVILNSDKDTIKERRRDAAVHVMSHFIRLLNDGSDEQISDFLVSQRWAPDSARKAVMNWHRIRADLGKITSLGDSRFDFRSEPPPHNARIVQNINWDSGRTTENEYFFTIEENFIGISSYRIKNSPSGSVAAKVVP